MDENHEGDCGPKLDLTHYNVGAGGGDEEGYMHPDVLASQSPEFQAEYASRNSSESCKHTRTAVATGIGSYCLDCDVGDGIEGRVSVRHERDSTRPVINEDTCNHSDNSAFPLLNGGRLWWCTRCGSIRDDLEDDRWHPPAVSWSQKSGLPPEVLAAMAEADALLGRKVEPGVAQKVRERPGKSTPETIPTAVRAVTEQRARNPLVAGLIPAPRLDPTTDSELRKLRDIAFLARELFNHGNVIHHDPYLQRLDAGLRAYEAIRLQTSGSGEGPARDGNAASDQPTKPPVATTMPARGPEEAGSLGTWEARENPLIGGWWVVRKGERPEDIREHHAIADLISNREDAARIAEALNAYTPPDYSWIKIKRYVDDTSKTWEERYLLLERHHEAETKFLIAEVERLKTER